MARFRVGPGMSVVFTLCATCFVKSVSSHEASVRLLLQGALLEETMFLAIKEY